MDRADFARISPLLDVAPAPFDPTATGSDTLLHVARVANRKRATLIVEARPFSNLADGKPRKTGADAVRYAVRYVDGKAADGRIVGTFPTLATAREACDAIARDPRLLRAWK